MCGLYEHEYNISVLKCSEISSRAKRLLASEEEHCFMKNVDISLYLISSGLRHEDTWWSGGRAPPLLTPTPDAVVFSFTGPLVSQGQ
jgi:hypothetical protein